MRGLKTLPAPHRSTHLGEVLRCVVRRVFELRAAFYRSVNCIYPKPLFMAAPTLATWLP